MRWRRGCQAFLCTACRNPRFCDPLLFGVAEQSVRSRRNLVRMSAFHPERTPSRPRTYRRDRARAGPPVQPDSSLRADAEEAAETRVASDRASAKCRFRPRRNGDRFGAPPRRRSRSLCHRPHGRLDRPRDRAIRERRSDPPSGPLSGPSAGRGIPELADWRGHEIETAARSGRSAFRCDRSREISPPCPHDC